MSSKFLPENSPKFTCFVRNSASTSRQACRSSRAARLGCSGEALTTLPERAIQQFLAPNPYTFQVSIDVVLVSWGYHFPSSCISLHHAPHCNHVTWKEKWHHSLSGVQRSHGVRFVGVQHQVLSRDRPNSHRLSGASVAQERTARDQFWIVVQVPRISGLQRSTRCIGETPESDKLLQRAEAFSALVLRLWLNVSQDVFKPELKPLGMMFHFTVLLLRFSSRDHNFDAPLFASIHEFIADVCTTRIDFGTAWSHAWSQPSIIQTVSAEFDIFGVSLSPTRITPCIELLSRTTSRMFTILTW